VCRTAHTPPALPLPPELFDDDDVLLPLAEHAPHGALRLPDGRAMAWAEYGSARGLPCVLIPDTGSSRLAPGWLLHDSALPSAIRLLAIDRPGIGVSDPIGFGGTEQPAEDLRRMVETLAATGMRISEALSLNIDSVDLSKGEAVIIGKGNKQRTVFFTERALTWINRYLALRNDPNQAIFTGANGRRLQAGSVQAMFRRTNAPLLCYLVGRAQGDKSLDELAEIVRSTS